ncbi:ArsR/SmtB family transcription factor [Pseudokineococcus marinus]|uniref:ArsR/SmtB family transcription factor n=1 Tax=Pseudokineococcus marinus TaxID=351215 RepID=UPI001BB148B5|nr:metalloregulator ArsR/SmtB family transcription factor [Pseudokineococcus marinus]
MLSLRRCSSRQPAAAASTTTTHHNVLANVRFTGVDRADDCDLLCLDLLHAEQVRAGLPAREALDDVAARAKALADPTRLRVATALATGGAMCGGDLAWVTGLATNLVSHHARALRAAGLAASRRDGKLVVYRLTPEGEALLAALTGTPSTAAGAIVRAAVPATTTTDLEAETR